MIPYMEFAEAYLLDKWIQGEKRSGLYILVLICNILAYSRQTV